jgi:hypothetical protein
MARAGVRSARQSMAQDSTTQWGRRMGGAGHHALRARMAAQ